MPSPASAGRPKFFVYAVLIAWAILLGGPYPKACAAPFGAFHSLYAHPALPRWATFVSRLRRLLAALYATLLNAAARPADNASASSLWIATFRWPWANTLCAIAMPAPAAKPKIVASTGASTARTIAVSVEPWSAGPPLQQSI